MNIASNFPAYPWLLIAAVPFLYFLHLFFINDTLPWNWPLVGMLPFMLRHFFEDLSSTLTPILEKADGTYFYKGIWFTNTDFLSTSNPENVRHIMNKTSTYIKGPEWRMLFDVLGPNTVFNVDFEQWKQQRRIFHSFISSGIFHQYVDKVLPTMIEKQLIPLLDHVVEHEPVIDLQDLISRNSFCFSSMIISGQNSESLSIGFPRVPVCEALDDAFETVYFRYLVPKKVWKLLGWLNIGFEKRRRHALSILDNMVSKYMSEQRQKLDEQRSDNGSKDVGPFELFKCYMTEHELTGPKPSDEVIKDNLVSMIMATRDTTSSALSWFFYILSKNPVSLKKIREELKAVLALQNHDAKLRFPFCLDEMNKLNYLHAALCESLRLFPPVPFESRFVENNDILPSGHRVYKNMRILILSYSMGRMRSVWEDDCHEFKPERWITEEGGIKRESPHKFFSFASGPRICPGKDIAFTFLKAIVASLMLNYNIEVLPGQKITPKRSVILQMDRGLKVRITRNL